MTYTKSTMRAVNKYQKKHYDKVCITMPKGQKALWQEEADREGLSVNMFVRSCVEDRFKKLEGKEDIDTIEEIPKEDSIEASIEPVSEEEKSEEETLEFETESEKELYEKVQKLFADDGDK